MDKKLLEQEIEKAVKVLKEGKTILYPTDTIWGIGCDATNAKAVDKIYKIKRREKGKSMIILLDSAEKLQNYVEKVPAIVYDLIEQTQTPLTIIYQNAKNLAKNLTPEDNSIAIRIVKGEFCNEMIKRFGKPVVSTSANLSGAPSPLSFNDVAEEIVNQVDHVVHVFKDRIRSTKASKIIKLEENGLFKVIRE